MRPRSPRPWRERDRAYAGSVIEHYAMSFIKRHQAQRCALLPRGRGLRPAQPHAAPALLPRRPGLPADVPRPAARRQAGQLRPGGACTSLTTKDLPGFGDDRKDNRPLTRKGKRAKAWNTRANPFRPAASVNDLRNRAMMAQSVDRTVRKILRTVDDNTYVVLTSDNGFHLGQNGLGRGKGTAYDTDVHVPLLRRRARRGARARARELTSNIDLAPTFEEIAGSRRRRYRFGAVAGARPSRDPALVRRNHVFFEHTAQALTKNDPDSALNGDELDRIPSYVAVRSRTGLLIRYDFDNDADRTALRPTSSTATGTACGRRRTPSPSRGMPPRCRHCSTSCAVRPVLRGSGDDPVGAACRTLTS